MKRFTYVLPLAKTLLIKAAQLHLRSAAPTGQVMHLPHPRNSKGRGALLYLCDESHLNRCNWDGTITLTELERSQSIGIARPSRLALDLGGAACLSEGSSISKAFISVVHL